MRPTAPIFVTLVLAAALGLASAPPAEAAHAHYLRLLRQGTFALEQGEPETAAADLRLACFGFLEEPPLLGECLVRLGLAQAAINDGEGFGETFRRVVEVEQRFGGFGAADLSAEERAAFEAAIVERIPPRTLGYSDVFRHLIPHQPNRPKVQEEPTRRSAPPERSEPEPPPSPPPSPTPPPSTETARPAEPTRLSREDRATLQRAGQLLERAEQRSELDEPYRMARQVADANPGSRDAQHLTAVIAYRSSRWSEAVRYFRRGGDPGDDNPEILFYLAVAQYESGDLPGARATLRRSLPRLEKTPFVRRYQEKILGAESLSTEGPRGSANNEAEPRRGNRGA